MGLAVGLMAAGIGLQVAGQIQAGRAAQAQAKGEAAMAGYNQKVSEQNAKAAELKSAFDQQRQARFGQRVMGTLRARLGASGAMTGEGAPLALETEQGAELALENALIGYEGQITAGQYKSQAAIYGMEGQLAKSRAKYAMQSAYMGAASTLLTGFGQMGQQGMFGSSTGKASSTAASGTTKYNYTSGGKLTLPR